MKKPIPGRTKRVRRSDDIYVHADEAIEVINAMIEAGFQKLAITTAWDEIHVLRAVRDLYDELDRGIRKQYLETAVLAYHDAARELRRRGLDAYDVPDDYVLYRILTAYDHKMGYRYNNEWSRKRDRLAEQMMGLVESGQAEVNGNAVREALLRAMKPLAGQARNMADTMTDEARRKAFVDAGIAQVRWNTQKDGKVCMTCRGYDGVVFPIDKIPPKHPRCRCYLTPA